ncbi:MAG: glycosyltransferase family 2 protein [Candidatus Binatia bacterium]
MSTSPTSAPHPVPPSAAPDAAHRVSIILPAYNEAATIAAVVQGCRAALPQAVEILVVDDGSRDDTAARAEAAGARVLRLQPNRGKGEALRIAIDQSAGAVLVFLDADGQDDPAEIPLLLAALERGADLVIGSRFLGHFDPGAITALNRAGTHFINGVVNLLFGAHITDTQAGFRAVRRSLLQRLALRAQRYDIETELLLQAIRAGGRVVEVPVRRSPRQHGVSGLHPLFDGLRILRRILRVRFQA